MKELSAYQRVRLSLNHWEPDRVPSPLWGGPYGLVDDFYLCFVDYLGLPGPVAPFRKGHNISYLDDRVLEKLGTDPRYVWPGDSPSSPSTPTARAGMFLDGYGQAWTYRAPYYFAGAPLLAGASADDIEKRVRWPDVSDPKWTSGVAERSRALREGTDCFVIARMVTAHGPYMTAGQLRGSEQFFIDMCENPDFVLRLVERVTDALAGLLKYYLAACGSHIGMIELPGDDYAKTKGMAFSPCRFRRYHKPAVQRLVETAKNDRADLKVMARDGALEPILQDFIDLGVEVVHPLEPLPAMDLEAIKAKCGSRLTFLGGIYIVHALPGKKEDVVNEVKNRLRQLGPGGGYVLAPANHVQTDVPPENLVTLYEAARQYGRYPIRLQD